MISKITWSKPLDIAGKYDFLENESIVSKLLEFEEDTTCCSLSIPHYIVAHVFGFWRIYRLQEGISSSQVNFPEKKVRITYNSENVSLRTIIYLLSAIGYEPYISLDNYETGVSNGSYSNLQTRSSILLFGNIMLLSFQNILISMNFEIIQTFFRSLIFTLSLPAFTQQVGIMYLPIKV
jgi:Cu+-exporting ATPase